MSEQNETPDAVEAAEAAATEQPPPPPPQTPKERKVAARARRGQRRASTPEERREAKKQKAAARSRWRANRKARRSERGTPPGEPTPPAEPADTNPQTRLGTVVSTKSDKTITVRIDMARRHKRYQKIVRSSWTLHAHDERNEAGEGDLVRVMECRPMSRTKRWRLTDVLEKAR